MKDYSSWLLPAVARTLAAANLNMRDVDLYAVASGSRLIHRWSASAWATS